MKAVIYARYSSDSQREESIEGQLRECHEYAKKNGIVVIGEYIDRAMTGRNDDRPDFQRMIKDSYQKKFDALIVWKLDRFSRDYFDFAFNQKILNDNGVRIVSATEAIPDDPSGILLQMILIGQSVYYSKELAVKINRGLTENALKGKINGGTVTFGYRLTKEQTYEIDEDQAVIVREVFTRYDEGEKMSAIAKELTLRGINTRYGTGITINTVHKMLKNRRYLGEYRFHEIFHKDGIPRIIPDDLFERVQRRMEKSQRTPALNKGSAVDYLLTTKLYCGRCGTAMAGESGTGRHGEIHYYYKCGNAKRKKGCTRRAVKKDWIERIVIDYTVKFIMDDKLIDIIADRILSLLGEENRRIPQLKARLKEIEKGIENILNAIQMGILTSSTRERLEQLEASKQEVQERLWKEELKKPTITKEQIVGYIKHFRDIDPTDPKACKTLIDVFVNRIYLYDDKLLITYNYKNDRSHEIFLEDVSNELGSNLENMSPPSKTPRFSGLFVLLGGPSRQRRALLLRRSRKTRFAFQAKPWGARSPTARAGILPVGQNP